jgi:hypothetical protein
MAGDSPYGDGAAANPGETMRLFIFRSKANPDLRAFGGDPAGLQLPSRFKPRPAVAAARAGIRRTDFGAM